ncbi:hypothetical protein AB1Y20_013442 [Prymnesium parvum]|uniref:Cilia- and flagella-associated protein 157 n=1 Tax=Prymnesium parvum TaxID=97485 RepID=A0AB34IHA7_PRYPA
MKRGGVTGMFAQSKRVRQAEAARLIGRLCDLKDAAYVFFDDHAAGLAKERGLLRSWTATEKYRDLEKQLLDILRESHGIDAIDERQLRETIPNELLPESAEALVQQVLRHQRYENAARELALEAIEEAQVEHERAMHKLKLEHETEITRVKVSCDMRSTADVEAIGDHLQQTREDYDEKVTNLENKVTLLKSKLEEAAAKQHEVESKAREQLEEMEDALQEMQERVAKAEEERDLKREAAHKLKEEVIGNDRLTVANLNRIKSLEADLQASQTASFYSAVLSINRASSKSSFAIGLPPWLGGASFHVMMMPSPRTCPPLARALHVNSCLLERMVAQASEVSILSSGNKCLRAEFREVRARS